MGKIKITYNNETRTIKEWSRILGINESTLRHRYTRYGNNEKVFSPHNPKAKRYEYEGQFYTVNELSEILSIKPDSVRKRINRNNQLVSKLPKDRYISFKGISYTPTEFIKEYVISRSLLYYYLAQIKSGKISTTTFYEVLLSLPEREETQCEKE